MFNRNQIGLRTNIDLINFKPHWGGHLLNKRDYDPFIDYLKGLCIIFVIVHHSIPEPILDKLLFCLWGNQAVPIFFIIQSFHAYKKGNPNVSFSIRKLWKRIIKPFFIALTILYIYLVILPFFKGADFLEKSFFFMQYGGPAPGSYYVWVYLQMVIVIQFCSYIIRRNNRMIIAIFFLIVSILLEIICSICNIPPLAYRLLFFRYFFLIWIGYFLCNEIKITPYGIFLVFISAVAIIVFRYSSICFEPFFVTTIWGWSVNHWICYPFCIFLIWLFRIIFLKTQTLKLTRIVKLCGKFSYEIFLCQMLYFVLPIQRIVCKLLSNELLFMIVYLLFSLFMCIIPVLYIKTRKVM